MLNIKIINSTKDLMKYLPIANLLGGVFLFEIFSNFSNNFLSNPYNNSLFSNYYINWFEKIDFLTNIESIGQILYTFYVIQFLIAGIILLVAVIGAVVLTVDNSTKETKKQYFFKQISRKFKKVI